VTTVDPGAGAGVVAAVAAAPAADPPATADFSNPATLASSVSFVLSNVFLLISAVLTDLSAALSLTFNSSTSVFNFVSSSLGDVVIVDFASANRLSKEAFNSASLAATAA
jgi:hypothetical protein